MMLLHFHPLSSYCHKVLIALYENGTPFEPAVVDLSNDEASAEYRKISPFGKMPALVDSARGQTVNEATIIIEYLDAFYPGATKFIPADPDAAWQTRMWDRFFDNYLHDPMQRCTGDMLRPAESRDPFGVAEARRRITGTYDIVERHMQGREWIGDTFSLADCAAAPALFYTNTILPLGEAHANTRAYLGRLMARPSYARALAEAEPFFGWFPFDTKPQRVLQPAAHGGSKQMATP